MPGEAGAMTLTWILRQAGWARCAVADGDSQAEIRSISYITPAPEDFLTAVARLTAGEPETRAEFESEPAVYRWIFRRTGSDTDTDTDTDSRVHVRILLLRNGHGPDADGQEIWTTDQTIDAVATATLHCFDQVAETYTEADYLDRWRRPFPRTELEALRSIRTSRR